MGALDAFSRAYAIYKAPTIGVYVARCQHALGRHAAALATYDEVLALPVASDAPKPVKAALDEARVERQDIVQRVSWLEIQVNGATSFKILIDGVEGKPQSGTKYVLDAGPHVVVARADGFADRASASTLSPRKHRWSRSRRAFVGGARGRSGAGAAPEGEPVFQGPTFAQDKYAAEEKRRRAEQEAEQSGKRRAQRVRHRKRSARSPGGRASRARAQGARGRGAGALREAVLDPRIRRHRRAAWSRSGSRTRATAPPRAARIAR